jgi:hypothetical protein
MTRARFHFVQCASVVAERAHVSARDLHPISLVHDYLREGATMVSAVCGIFIWKEFVQAPPASRKLIPPCSSSFYLD